MGKLVTTLTYEGPAGPLVAAKIDDPRLTEQVARAAIAEAKQAAEAIAVADPFLAGVKADQAAQLERVLGQLVPGLREGGDAKAH